MTSRDELDSLSSRELHDRAVHRALRHLDAGFLWELLRAIPAVEALKLEGDVKVGVNVIRRALEEPFRQIVYNAGKEASVILNEVKLKGGNWGYDARTDKVVDMIEAGIIDPAKVTKQALLNASSIAGLMLTTEALVSEIKEEEKQSAGGGPGGPGGMGGMY